MDKDNEKDEIKYKGMHPKYDTPEELNEKVELYFESDAFVVVDKQVDKDGNEAETKIFRPTITGLALFLGFCSRQSMYDYEKKDNFSYSIKRARLLIEHYYETKLTGNNVTGPVFALKQFGWTDKQEIDHTSGGKPIQPRITFSE